jgi:hypothetical protein
MPSLAWAKTSNNDLAAKFKMLWASLGKPAKSESTDKGI